MRITLCIASLFALCGAQDDLSGLNEILREDVNLVGPGVRARLTPTGTGYVASVVAAALTSEVAVATVPGEPQTTKLASLPSVTFSDMHMRLFEVPKGFNVSPVSPNVISVQLQNMNLSVSAYGRGVVSDVQMDSSMEIRTNKFTLNVMMRIGKNARGNPHLKVESCSVPPRIPVTISVAKALTPKSGAVLADAIAADGHTVFEQLICPRLRFIIDSRVNQRFGLLSSRISLGETSNFDMVRSLLMAEDEQRRIIRQNTVRLHDSPVPSPRQNVMRQQPMVQRRPMMRQTVMRQKMRRTREQDRTRDGRQQRQMTAGEFLMVRSPRSSLHNGEVAPVERNERARESRRAQQTEQRVRVQRQDDAKFHTFLRSFNLSRADSLILDFGMVEAPFVSLRGIEMATSGEISARGARTPFGPHPFTLPAVPSQEMLQIVVSDYVPNTLMYHGHRTGLFNTRVDPSTPQFGSVMRTTCDMATGALFCVGDLFPTLRDMVPDKGVAFLFSTLTAPAVAVKTEQQGGIQFRLTGLITIMAIESNGMEVPIGSMEIHIEATMKMRISSKSVRGKVNLESIQLVTRSPAILVQDELDDAGFLSREILQRMVNDILKQGIPIPVHPLFKLQKPKLTLLNRSMLVETNFQLNQNLIRQLTAEKLVAA